MKLKKLVSALVSGAMILGTMAAVPVFAEGATLTVDDLNELTNALSADEGSTVVINGDIALEGPITFTNTITLEISENGSLSYESDKNSQLHLVTLQDGSTFNLASGAKVVMNGNAETQNANRDWRAIYSKGVMNCNTLAGSITINNARGRALYANGNLNIDDMAANILMNNPNGNNRYVYGIVSYGGNITMNKLSGSVKTVFGGGNNGYAIAAQQGSVAVNGDITGKIETYLGTSHAGIALYAAQNVTVAGDISGTIYARGGSGSGYAVYAGSGDVAIASISGTVAGDCYNTIMENSQAGASAIYAGNSIYGSYENGEYSPILLSGTLSSKVGRTEAYTVNAGDKAYINISGDGAILAQSSYGADFVGLEASYEPMTNNWGGVAAAALGNDVQITGVTDAIEVVSKSEGGNDVVSSALVVSTTRENIDSVSNLLYYVARGNTLKAKEIAASMTNEQKRLISNYNEVLDSLSIISAKDANELINAIDNAQDGDTIKLLDDISGNGIVIPEGKNITIDLNGHTYNVDGATIGSAGTETNGFQLLKNSNIKIKNGTITSDKAKMLIQNYSNLTLENVTLDGSKLQGDAPYTLSNNCGNTVLKGNTNIIAKSGGYAFDCYYWPDGGYGEGVTVTLGEDFTGKITGKIEMSDDGTDTANAASKQKISISAGTFTTDVADYVADGYYQKKNNDNTYTVVKSEATVINTAKTTGATVTLDDLKNNTAVDHEPDATYKVVVETAPAADAAKANDAIKANADTNTSKAMFDISVVKIDSNGTKTVLDGENGVKDQQVTLTLGETPTGTVHVYHVVGNSVVEITSVTVSGNTVTFIAPSFSTYAVTYNAAPLSNSDIAKEVSVAFDRVGDTNEYDIVLKGKNNLKLNRFMSADLTFDMNVTSGAVGYTIKPSTNINIVDNGNGRYEFNLDGLNASGATGAEVPIGKVIFEGNGSINFGVKTEGVTTNIVNTAKSANNIVDNYTTAGNGVDTGRLELNNAAANGVINATFTAPTKDLTVNIAYNNKINNNAAAYQDMTVTISGGDLTTPIVKHLGSDEYTLTDNVYTVTVANELTQNTAYTVTVEGAGYRTARHTVTMTANKTLNFWNNVLDAANATAIEEGKGNVTKNFLAGDIVKDNNINIYDLSAVVSYFGTSNDVNGASAYARYDLNRDGKIDSKDVAYVLVSWNN